MFVGHFGLGFAGKSVAGRVSLGTLFLAAQFIDLLWPTLLLIGLETVEISPGITALTPLDFTHYPISHSLLSVVVWAVLFGAIYFLIRRLPVAAFVCGLLVASHWLLDFVTHRPDLPLAPMGGFRVGLGLWNHPAAAIAAELLVFGAGLFLYVSSTRASDRLGVVGLWALVAFLLVVHMGNVLGPPPPSERALAWVSQTQWILIIWAYWLDRHREARPVSRETGEQVP
jgi:hypothetical protein